MSGVNKVILVGHLGRDPEVRRVNQTVACNLNVATSRKYTNKAGETVDEVEWHRVVAFGKMAENCGQYLAKGRQVYIEGRLKTSNYEKEGVTHYSTQIVADVVQFLGGKGEGKKQAQQREPGEDLGDEIPF